MTVKRPLANNHPIIMGILNVTPDSFSDGGLYLDTRQAVRRGLEMVAEGADILDIGGESTRPGSLGVSEEEEKRRIIPVIKALSRRTGALISVDTRKPGVADAALEAGAGMLNDVSNLRDIRLAELVAAARAHLVLMHSRGTPEIMQQLTQYEDVVKEVIEELMISVETALACGVPRDRIWLDPGIGFAKTAAHNLEIFRRLEEITSLGYPVLIGPSRKSFIGAFSGADIDNRIGGTAAAVTAGIMKGASAVRVHDVSVMRQATTIARAITAHQAPKVGEAVNA